MVSISRKYFFLKRYEYVPVIPVMRFISVDPDKFGRNLLLYPWIEDTFLDYWYQFRDLLRKRPTSLSNLSSKVSRVPIESEGVYRSQRPVPLERLVLQKQTPVSTYETDVGFRDHYILFCEPLSSLEPVVAFSAMFPCFAVSQKQVYAERQELDYQTNPLKRNYLQEFVDSSKGLEVVVSIFLQQTSSHYDDIFLLDMPFSLSDHKFDVLFLPLVEETLKLRCQGYIEWQS